MGGLRFVQIASGLPDPHLSSSPQLHYVLCGVQRGQSSTSDKRLPVTLEILQLLRAAWSDPGTGSFNRSMLWAACCLGFFGFLRSGEFTCPSLNLFQDHILSPRDVSVDSLSQPSVATARLRRSKTDPFGRGVTVFVGRTSHSIRPVAAILSCLGQRSTAHGLLFLYEDGSCLSRQRLTAAVHSALQSQGIDLHFLASGHSFRIGAATAAAQAGLEDSVIQTLGRWRSSSFLHYIRTPGCQLAAVSSRLLDPMRLP